MTQINDIKCYKDGDRYIIGRAAWQTCYSMTYGIAEAYNRREVSQIAQWVRGLSLDQIEAAKRVYWTDGRFEQACAHGLFGPDW